MAHSAVVPASVRTPRKGEDCESERKISQSRSKDDRSGGRYATPGGYGRTTAQWTYSVQRLAPSGDECGLGDATVIYIPSLLTMLRQLQQNQRCQRVITSITDFIRYIHWFMRMQPFRQLPESAGMAHGICRSVVAIPGR